MDIHYRDTLHRCARVVVWVIYNPMGNAKGVASQLDQWTGSDYQDIQTDYKTKCGRIAHLVEGEDNSVIRFGSR